MMTRRALDDRIGISHMISCECGDDFQSFTTWLLHKKETGHHKAEHIVAVVVNDNQEQLFQFKAPER